MRTHTRPRQVNVGLSNEEHEAITAKAAAAGVSVSEFVSDSALGRPSRRRDLATREIVAALNRVGSLLNQLARAANMTEHRAHDDVVGALAFAKQDVGEALAAHKRTLIELAGRIRVGDSAEGEGAP